MTLAVSLQNRLLSMQVEAASRDDRLAGLNLSPIRRKAPSLPVIDAVVSLKVTLTIDGASYLEVGIDDPDWLIERSGLLDLNDDGRLDPNVVITLDRIRFRVVKANRSSPTLTLTAEDEIKVLLDQHNKKIRASRGTSTRAEFVERMCAEVKAKDIPFVSPEVHKRQPVARPELPDTHPHGDTGFDDGATFKIKGVKADAGQMREAATALGQADLLSITPHVRLAMLVAGIGESLFRNVPNAQGSAYGGVFGARKDRKLTTAQQAHYFLIGGEGFQAGGAIAYAASHPQATAGEIAYKVEGDLSNFPSEAAAEHFYQQWHDEAKTIAGLWQSGQGDANSEVLSYKGFEFTRGLPGKKETSWTTAMRLAEEVAWRFFAVGGVACFVSDNYLISQPATLIIDTEDEHGDRVLPGDVGLLAWPDYDHDEGKLAAEVTLSAVAARWAVLPGDCVVLRNMGTISGRWICETFVFDVFDPTAAQITLTRPITPRKEPAPEAITVSTGDDPVGTTGGAAAAIAWAKSKIGHYKEEFGANIGPELDTLEARYKMRGQPWCAMFATTALVHGGLTKSCRTPLVAEINRWCREGSHGYVKGYKATPRPGDLVTFGDGHVALVSKVRGDSVDIIEGNNGAGTVGTRTIVKGQGTFVRPDWVN